MELLEFSNIFIGVIIFLDIQLIIWLMFRYTKFIVLIFRNQIVGYLTTKLFSVSNFLVQCLTS